MSYQGWKNYETWAVKLWIDNEEPSYRYWGEAAREAKEVAPSDENCQGERPIWSPQECARFRLADRLKDELEEAMPEVDGVWADLLRAAFDEVDWHEIAESLIGTVEEEDKYEAKKNPE